MSPELVSTGIDDDISGYNQKPSWDVAVRYQDLKRLQSIPEKEKQKLKRRAIEGVLQRARSLLGSVLKPEQQKILDWRGFLEKGGRGDLDVLETLEQGLERGLDLQSAQSALSHDALRFDTKIEKDADLLLVMDGSLSMTGEKIALLAVAVAVVALCVPSARLGLIAFASHAKCIKPFGEEKTIEEIIERVLEIPTAGLTNLEGGLKQALQVLETAHKQQANTILISDGKYTEGKDPTYLAQKFRRLHALKLGRDIAGRALLMDLIGGGHGNFFEARRISDLPKTMYVAMKNLMR